MSDSLDDQAKAKGREIIENLRHHVGLDDRVNAGEAIEKVDGEVTKVFDPIKDRIQRPESN